MTRTADHEHWSHVSIEWIAWARTPNHDAFWAYRESLVDFIGRHRGHDVCLCWKLGEETIGYWLEIQTGFAGRQPVSVLEED